MKNDEVRLSDKLSYEFIYDMYKNDDFSKLDKWDYYVDNGYITLDHLYTQLYQETNNPKYERVPQHNRPISKIRFLDERMNDRIIDASKNMIGIHIRRGNGIIKTDSDIKSLPNDIQDKFNDYCNKYFDVVDAGYEFFRDELYFRFIDSILEKNPKKKIYISHDLPDEFMEHYYIRYGDSIRTKKDLRNTFKSYYNERIRNMKHLIDYANVIDNLVDLFMLSNCPYIITSPGSSWSEFAKYYKDKESDNILDVNKKLEQSDYIHTILASKRKTNFI